MYRIDFKRVIMRKLGIADGRVTVDGGEVYACKDLRVGLFKNADQNAAPRPAECFPDPLD